LKHFLSIDVEDWFHLLDVPHINDPIKWDQLENRVYETLPELLELLDRYKIKAVFFVLGWQASKNPDLVSQIINKGHSLGSHTHSHQLVYTQTDYQFEHDLVKSIDTLIKYGAAKIECFRAPGFSITEKNISKLNILRKNGIKLDSSIFSAHRNHGGAEGLGLLEPTLLKLDAGDLIELPITPVKVCGFARLPFSGGGYFRVLPLKILLNCYAKTSYSMSYFHPRDFDFDQPILPNLSLARRLMSYSGLKKSMKKFEHLLHTVQFTDFHVEELITASYYPVMDLNEK